MLLLKPDRETCEGCGGRVRVIASIEDPALIERVLAHRKQRLTTALAVRVACTAVAVAVPHRSARSAPENADRRCRDALAELEQARPGVQHEPMQESFAERVS